MARKKVTPYGVITLPPKPPRAVIGTFVTEALKQIRNKARLH